MKKFLGFTALAAVFVLTSCGGSNAEIVCTGIESFVGVEMEAVTVLTAQVDGNYVTAADIVMRIDTSEIDSDHAELIADQWDSEIEGDYIVVSDSEEIGEEFISVEQFRQQMEVDGFTCK